MLKEIILASLVMPFAGTTPEGVTKLSDQQLMDHYHSMECHRVLDDSQREYCWEVLTVLNSEIERRIKAYGLWEEN